MPLEPLRDTFLAMVDTPAATSLTEAGEKRRFDAGADLFHQGDPSQHVVVIHSGWVKVTAVTRRGWEALLAVRGAGDIVGEASALDRRPRSATVRTLTPLEATVMSADRFRRVLLGDAALACQLLSYISSRLRDSDRRRSEFGSTSGTERLFALLVDLSEQYGRAGVDGIEIGIPLSQRELAAAVGVSRQVAAGGLRTLRERRIIVTGRQRIVVTALDALRALVSTV